MTGMTRRFLLSMGTMVLCSAVSPPALALTSLTDISGALLALPPATILTAREIMTLDAARPAAQAMAVVNGRIR